MVPRGPAALDPDVRAHLSSCAECRAGAAQEEALDRVLGADPNVEPRPGFDTRFFARLEQQRARKRVRWLFAGLGLPALAAAAALLLTHRGATQDDLELAMNLDLVEDMEMLRRLDEVEAFAELQDVDVGDIEAVREPR